jgi:hypothetical protein
MRRKVSFLLAAVTAAVVVTVAGATTGLSPKTLVLQKSDVPAGMKLVFKGSHPNSGADIQPAPGSRGWIVAYARLTQSSLVIASSAYVFPSSSAAHAGFGTMSTGFAKRGPQVYGSTFSSQHVSGLGAQQRAWAASCNGTLCANGSSQAALLVRTGSVVWGVNVVHAGGKSTAMSTALTYARKQKTRVGSG